MLLPNAVYAVLHASTLRQSLVRSVLASLVMPIRILRRTAPAGVFLCFASALDAAELDVKVTPSNSALRENVENYIGELDDRSEEELLRYSRIAQEQANKAMQALGYYHAVIETRVTGGETPRLARRMS